MDNKQAAAVLREQIREYRDNGYLNEDQNAHERATHDRLMDCVKLGADGLEFKEWLFEETGDIPRVLILHMARQKYGNDVPFLTYCEARFEESKRHG